jgi:hypothetical protein
MPKIPAPKVSLPKFSLPRFSFGGGGGDAKGSAIFSLIAFNFTVILVVLARTIFHRGGWTGGFAAVTVVLAALLGAVAAGVTYFVASRMK